MYNSPKCRRILSVALLLCLSYTASAERFVISATPISLNSTKPDQTQLGSLRWVSGFHLSSPNQRFGGISGFERRGNTLFAVSDRGFWIVIELTIGSNGEISGIAGGDVYPIRSPSGAALQGREADAEELIFRPDGRVLVTFEHSHRVGSFGNISAPAKPFYLATEHAPVSLPGLSKIPENGGLEAATWHPQLGLIAIQEHALPHSELHPAWSYGVTKTRTFYYRGAAPYRPTGMTHAPNGDLITIERHFSKETGPVSRVVRIGVEPLKRAATEISGKNLGQFDGAVSRDNFESITMGPQVAGRPTILLCSDDNYAAHQRTLLLQMAL